MEEIIPEDTNPEDTSQDETKPEKTNLVEDVNLGDGVHQELGPAL